MQEKIINFLKKSESYLSGEEISRSLNMTRAAIWKYMQELRKDGYEIVAVPHLGYKLVSCPDKFFPQEIQFELGTKIIGQRIFYEENVSSTMDAAFRLALEGAAEGAVVCAEGQSKGRGRMGRGWISPKGKGIYMSVILRPKLPALDTAKLTLLAGVAAAQALKKISGLNVQIKWPNDLLIGSGKAGGILTELNAEMDRVKFVIVGIGLNVNTPASQLPSGATSLKNETARTFNRVEAMQEVLRSLEEWYLRFIQKGFAPVLERWKDLAVTLGKRVRIADSAGFIEGDAVDIDTDGGLLIRQDSGVVVKRMAGDIAVAR